MSLSKSAQRRADRKVYNLGLRFLKKFEQVTPDVLERHLAVAECERRDSLPGVFEHLVFTAQNYQSLPKVIGCALGGIENLSELLFGFDPAAVYTKYGEGGWEQLLDNIDAEFFPGSPRRRVRMSLWPRFCRAILSGARFLRRFKSVEHFNGWVARHDQNVRTRYQLVLKLEERIHGFGAALACDFVKELGFSNWCKPDVHLKGIFTALGLADDSDNLTVFRAINRLARNAEVTPYRADKVFWLISSGRFYHDDFEIGRHRKRFIKYAAKRLEG